MATHDETAATRTWQRPTVFYNHAVKWLVYAVIVGFILWSIWWLRVPLERLLIGIEGVISLVSSMVPPDFGPRQRQLIWTGMIESIAMSVVATIFGVAISIPIAFMAARNLAPNFLYYIGRGLISISRAFHELIFAIIAVKAVGFGPLAGVITLVFGTVGFFSKLLAEDLEDIDPQQLDAIRATGASRMQVLLYGVYPQVVPRIVGLTIYRWDINIRASTVVGIVGAGGIGITLINSFDRYEYAFSFAIILTIIAIVIVGEIVSAIVRRRVQ